MGREQAYAISICLDVSCYEAHVFIHIHMHPMLSLDPQPSFWNSLLVPDLYNSKLLRVIPSA
jgi:hypothetical protein